MPVKRYPHSIRFSREEWDSITHAAEAKKLAPGEYAREAAVIAAAEESDLAQPSLTPELIALLKRTFRGVHVLAYLKREELERNGGEQAFRRAATAARTAQSETLSGQE